MIARVAGIASTRNALNPTHLQFRQNKYNAKKTLYDGILYDSKAEAKYAQELDLLRLAQGKHKVLDWERQIRIPLIVNGIKICVFIPDFLVKYADGRKVLVEVKGMKTPIFNLKVRLFKATWLLDHPDIEYVINP